MWTAYTAVLVIAAAASALALWLLARVAPSLGLVDQPSARKQHARQTPLVGGLAIALGAVTALGFGALLDHHVADTVRQIATRPGLVLGALLLLLVGAIDDRSPIQARYKLGVQLLCCIGAVVVDRQIVGDIGIAFGGFSVSLGPLVVPFTILVMLTILNGMNMVDGVDGVAGGIAFVVMLVMAKAALTGGFMISGLSLTALLGALGAFLVVNFPFRRDSRARVFLGDAGSLLLGFLLAYFAVRLSAVPHRVFRPSTALWFFFIPVADAMLLYLRRLVRHGAPFLPGRDHIHHILLRRWSPRTVSWLMVGSTAAMAGLSYVGERFGVSPFGHVAAWCLLFAWFAVRTRRSWEAAWLRSRRAERDYRRVAAPAAAAGAAPNLQAYADAA